MKIERAWELIKQKNTADVDDPISMLLVSVGRVNRAGLDLVYHNKSVNALIEAYTVCGSICMNLYYDITDDKRATAIKSRFERVLATKNNLTDWPVDIIHGIAILTEQVGQLLEEWIEIDDLEYLGQLTENKVRLFHDKLLDTGAVVLLGLINLNEEN